MPDIAAMSTTQLATLVDTLREDLGRAKAAENWVLVQDLRRALANVSEELKERRATPKSHSFLQRTRQPVLGARS